MRHDAPKPDAKGVRWYGRRDDQREDKARCIVGVWGFHASHQCANKRKDGTEYCGVHMPAPETRLTMWFVGIGHNWEAARKGRGIQAVEVAKISDARVQLPSGSWDKIKSRSGVYYPTLAEAVAHVREGLVRDRDYHARAIVEADVALAKFDKHYPRKK